MSGHRCIFFKRLRHFSSSQSPTGLMAGALTALLLLGHSWLIKKQSLKILDIGTTKLFVGLCVYFLVAKPAWSVMAVRLAVDCGL